MKFSATWRDHTLLRGRKKNSGCGAVCDEGVCTPLAPTELEAKRLEVGRAKGASTPSLQTVCTVLYEHNAFCPSPPKAGELFARLIGRLYVWCSYTGVFIYGCVHMYTYVWSVCTYMCLDNYDQGTDKAATTATPCRELGRTNLVCLRRGDGRASALRWRWRWRQRADVGAAGYRPARNGGRTRASEGKRPAVRIEVRIRASASV